MISKGSMSSTEIILSLSEIRHDKRLAFSLKDPRYLLRLSPSIDGGGKAVPAQHLHLHSDLDIKGLLGSFTVQRGPVIEGEPGGAGGRAYARGGAGGRGDD